MLGLAAGSVCGALLVYQEISKAGSPKPVEYGTGKYLGAIFAAQVKYFSEIEAYPESGRRMDDAVTAFGTLRSGI